MDFEHLLDGAEVLSRSGNAPVKGLDYDSRRIGPGYVFVAMRGGSTDGNRYIDAALDRGAVAVVTDSPSEPARGNVAWAVVTHGRHALASLSANFYRHPAAKLAVTGITGTNGKTTTAFIAEAILRHAGRKNALVGTVEYHLPDRVLAAPHTTPESLELTQLFAEALTLGATEAVMEVSSHALDQGRVFGVPFDVAVFTNLTRDHLDYHKDMETYLAAKRILFEGCGTDAPRVSVLNADDESHERFAEAARHDGSHVFLYGIEQGDFRTENLAMTSSGNRFDLVTPKGKLAVFSPLIGRVNVYNVLAASAAAFAREVPLDKIAGAIETMSRVPGRFEKVDEGQPFIVVVDYAHTDDALKNLTRLARETVRSGRVITVFGCGGDRDRTKRPLMGKAAGEKSDFVIVTSDNPRSEDPNAIIEEILPGVKPTGTPFAVEPDRRKAIALAISQAKPGDIVLLAGKGHERTQTSREGVFPFDDFEVAHAELRKAGYSVEKKGSSR